LEKTEMSCDRQQAGRRCAGIRPAIVHAAHFAAPYGGNFIASLAALRNGCAKRDWDFVLVLPEAARPRPWCGELLAGGWRIHFLPDKASPVRTARQLVRIVARENGIILHTHFTAYDIVAWVASRLARMRGKKVGLVWHGHSDFSVKKTMRRRIKDLVKYRLMGRTARIIAVFENIRQQRLDSGMAPERVRMIRNGVDWSRAITPTRSAVEVRAAAGIAEDSPLLLLFGWAPLIKGVDTAIQAAERLVADGRPVTLAVVGRELLQEFLDATLKGKRPPWLRVLPPQENVADLYHAAAIFLSCSRSEGFSYATVEAMANGRPVVLSDIPGLGWAHQAPGTVFFPPGDNAGLAEAIKKVLDWTPAERQRYTAANRDFAQREFDIHVWAEQILNFYREIVSPTMARSREG
jgi:glycosyltransferase involved in cell wall biosynthesis